MSRDNTVRAAEDHGKSSVGSMEAAAKVFLLFSLFSNWLDLNHLKSRIKRGFWTFF